MRRPSADPRSSKLPLVLSATALAVAVLGTTPLAAVAQSVAFPPNSVGSPQLKRNAVTAAKLAPNAVRSGHVLDGSLLASDFKPGQIPQGPKGDQGPPGERGASATKLFVLIHRDVNGVQRIGQQSGGITAGPWVGNRPIPGFQMIDVAFPQDVSACVALATMHHANGTFVSASGQKPLNTTINRAVVHVYAENSNTGIRPDVAVAVFC